MAENLEKFRSTEHYGAALEGSTIFLSFQPKNEKCCNFFHLLGNPAETPYLSVRDGKLSNAVWLVEVRPRKVAVHTFLGSAQASLIRPL